MSAPIMATIATREIMIDSASKKEIPSSLETAIAPLLRESQHDRARLLLTCSEHSALSVTYSEEFGNDRSIVKVAAVV